MKLSLKFLFFTIGLPSLALFAFLSIAYQSIADDRIFILNNTNNAMALTIAQQLDPSDWVGITPILKKLPLSQGFVIDKEGQIVAASHSSIVGKTIESSLPPSARQKLSLINANEGSFEDLSFDGHKAFYSFVRLPEQIATVILMTQKDEALRSASLLLTKAFGIFIIFVLFGIGTSSWFAKSVSAPLEMIADHTQNLATGNLNICLPNLGHDELGSLGEQFNSMIQKLRKTMSERETALKLQFEKELTVENYKFLYPPKSFTSGAIDFFANHQSIHSGEKDWWSYFQTPDHFVICLVRLPEYAPHAARIATAAKAALTLISENFTSTTDGMQRLHQCLLETSKASHEIPCLMISLDPTSGILSYSKAGFRIPLYVFNVAAEGGSETLELLNYDHGRGIGTEDFGAAGETSYALTPHSTIFIHSQGFYQLKNKQLESPPLEMIEKWLSETNAINSNLETLKAEMSSRINKFKSGNDILNDLTFMYLRWSPHAENNETI